jgi:hypothetical protein
VLAVIPGYGTRGFVVDTGYNNSLAFAEREWDALERLGLIRVITKGVLSAASGKVEVPVGRLETLTFGGRKLAGLTCIRSDVNLIGRQLISRYICTFDFPGQTLLLEPGPRIDEPDPVDCSGLRLALENGEYVIEFVDPQSPAAECDIHVSDVLLQFDGRPASKWTMFQLRRSLCEDGKMAKLVIRRGEERRDVSLSLKNFRETSPRPRRPSARPIPEP